MDSIEEIHGVNIFDEQDRLFYASASLSLHNNSKHSYGADFGEPKTLRIEWRGRYIPGAGVGGGAFGGGRMLGNFTVPVASRIPEDIFDGMRQGIGGFNLQSLAGGDFR